ncbi:ABC transporter permease [Paraliomyxa miuraensis]|uniref:ABC transporter permease n=1 Tax=Paraliomyxa miuraensis TaxID=376150 RepID=UPI00225B6F71|nr:ABC transporter permease [Paraliomyxa miuraensis]MCX4246228.1 ABC transporter permease [Paraliomyxa miuraensis]
MADPYLRLRRATPGVALGLGLLVFLLLPIAALGLASSPGELWAALAHPLVMPALALSARTTAVTLAIVIVTGTPLAWMLARARGPWARVIETAVELPIVIPPAVMGIALLLAFGRQGLLGGLGVALPFTTTAVIVAQVVVAAPFYVQSVAAGFRGVDDDLLLVARTLGASPRQAFLRVAVPLCLPAIVNGAALCWARALGEFGATLLFAGSLPGRTQTMPLAIHAALEADVRVATAVALVLALLAFVTLLAARAARRWLVWPSPARAGAER